MSNRRSHSTDADEKGPSVDTRLEALAHRVDWIDHDRLGIRHQHWVWMVEQTLTVSGAIIFVGLLAGASGVVPWAVIVPWLYALMSWIVGLLAVLTFIARIASVLVDRIERSQATRSLIETGAEDDP